MHSFWSTSRAWRCALSETMVPSAVDWQDFTDRLEEVEHHIARGQKFIAQTANSLQHATQLGLDASEGEEILLTLEAVQQIYLKERDELKQVLRRLAN